MPSRRVHRSPGTYSCREVSLPSYCLPNSFLLTFSNMHCYWIIDYVISFLDVSHNRKGITVQDREIKQVVCVRLVVILSMAGTWHARSHLGLGLHPPLGLKGCSGCVEQMWDQRPAPRSPSILVALCHTGLLTNLWGPYSTEIA